MDQVFQRIDQCDSAAGEAVLYNMLHCTDNGQAQWKDLLKYYEEQAEPRKKAEAILISLGKREGLYYLPEYVDTLQASHVGSVFFYRLLQILLLGSVVGGLWNVQILPLAGVMAIVNIAVYIMTRMKYEQQMSMMELIVLVIDTGKRLTKVQILPLAGVMAIVNIAVYIMTRMKYEQQMSMMELIVLVIDTGKRLTKEKCAGPVQKELEEKLKELGKLDKLIGKMSAMRRNSYSSDQGGKRLTKEKCAGPVQKELEEKLKELGKLDKLIGKMSAMRRNSYSSDQGVFLDYLFGITLWQLISYEKSVKWLENKRESYLQLFEEIGRLDAAISIASFRKSLPFYTEPEFHSERSVHMEEMYHPLIEEPVSNSMDWSRNCIITGSNASGKSTWIKAVAINLILAQTICTCTAKRFQMHPGQIMTSMAVRDDIMKGESYFLKEMKYLRRMLERFSEEKLTICIIDEILKGTNTKERIAASKAILDYMQRQNCLVMVASHDYELTVLLEGTYENYHFTERIGEDDIYFDYRLYPGAVTSGNAIKLLKFMKFPEEIVTEAKQQVTMGLADLQ